MCQARKPFASPRFGYFVIVFIFLYSPPPQFFVHWSLLVSHRKSQSFSFQPAAGSTHTIRHGSIFMMWKLLWQDLSFNNLRIIIIEHKSMIQPYLNDFCRFLSFHVIWRDTLTVFFFYCFGTYICNIVTAQCKQNGLQSLRSTAVRERKIDRQTHRMLYDLLTSQKPLAKSWQYVICSTYSTPMKNAREQEGKWSFQAHRKSLKLKMINSLIRVINMFGHCLNDYNGQEFDIPYRFFFLAIQKHIADRINRRCCREKFCGT